MFVDAGMVFFVPTFALIAGMMIAVGSMVTETRQGQQIAGALNMLFTLPFFFIVVFFSAPNSPLATALTIFPTTAFLTIALRWSMTTIPMWEMIVSWVLVIGFGSVHGVGSGAHLPHGHAALRPAPRLEEHAARACAPGAEG